MSMGGGFNRSPSMGMSRPYSTGAGYRGGSYEGPRGGSINYGAAGAGVRGPAGGMAGRGIGAVQATGPGGRTVTDVGRAGGAVGPGGAAVGRSGNIGAVSGPRGTAVAGSREGFARGPGGAYAGGYRNGAYGWHNGNYAAYHNGWVNGYWAGHYPGWGWGGYGYGGYGWGLGGYGLGLATGLGMWGLGSSLYGYGGGWGYMPYVNPYYDTAAPVVVASQPVYDYSQPIDTMAAAPAQDVADPAVSTFDQARDAFKAGDYQNALALTDQALKAVPNDSAIHQFRGVDLFALGRYPEAATTLYGVLSVGPGWDWTTLISLYPDVDTYTNQLRALEAYSRSNANDAASRFILAYLYLTSGQNDPAKAELQAIVKLQPTDRVSAQILQSMTATPSQQPPDDGSVVVQPQVPKEAPKDEGALKGSWTASPGKDTTIALNLGGDGKFTWKVTTKGQSHQLEGEATYANGILTLTQSGGGPPMVGQVSMPADGRFVFQALGGGPADPGLSFNRAS
jgi:tetratricopeptide (TPR) repeat protein